MVVTCFWMCQLMDLVLVVTLCCFECTSYFLIPRVVHSGCHDCRAGETVGPRSPSDSAENDGLGRRHLHPLHLLHCALGWGWRQWLKSSARGERGPRHSCALPSRQCSALIVLTFQYSPYKNERNKVKLISCVWLFAAPWTVAYQGPLSTGSSRQGYWSGLPFPSLGDLPNPGIEPGSPALQADALPSEPPGKPYSPYRFVSNTCQKTLF